MTARKPHRGFTIVELMITVAVLGILAAFAVPSMTDFYDRKRLVSQTEAISNLLQFARSEAIKHPSSTAGDLVTVTIKPSAPWFVGLRNGGACNNGGTPASSTRAPTRAQMRQHASSPPRNARVAPWPHRPPNKR